MVIKFHPILSVGATAGIWNEISHNKGSYPTAGQARCGTTSCYVDARTGALLEEKCLKQKIMGNY